MTTATRPILLDTHALIWLAQGALSESAVESIALASADQGLLVSVVTAWEIGLLHRKRLKTGFGPSFGPDPHHWYRRVVDRPGFTELELTSAVAITASVLPGDLHADPADRLLVATARALDAALMTRDGSLLDYASAGHVRAIEC